jgi:glycosyltransferase involved in cell wall biosynthesis
VANNLKGSLSLPNNNFVKRVRTLYEASCSDILKLRNAALQSPSLKYDSIESYNAAVQSLESAHGRTWCSQRALVEMPYDFRFSVVMPVYNEAQTIAEMMNRVCDVDLPMELIVVDDGSTDGTREEIELAAKQDRFKRENAFGQIGFKMHFHEKNQGKGAALKTGFGLAEGDVIGIQDADQEYNPQEFAALLATILSEEADVVYGSRFAKGYQAGSPLWHRFGNGLITACSNLKTGLNVSDAETCYKLMRKPVLDRILSGLQEKRFGVELEMTAKLARLEEVRFDERPISYDKRTYAEGKKIGVKDGFRALWCVLKY